ncbi:MAG TPA: proline--tRNA ligase [Candidatus Paceibacterota bacterium]|nr:proline--tRNA ligase [Verrucomicrobiota bacterium]HRY47775.1 proline--tRNA ligase [Candidatus Paceibacterota bacterium]
MRQSRHLGKTLREVPKDAQTAAHALMLRAGYLQQLAAGVYVYQPLLLRTLNKIAQVVREEMTAAGAEELLMPALQPRELWEESGRWERYTNIDGIMFAFKDRRGGMVCLGPTHEEVITDILRREIKSYKDLPRCVFQIQTKFRDEIRPRFGLMRAREFIMKDAYSFDADEASLEKSYEAMRQAYHRICERIGFRYRAVEADSGAIGGSGSQEFMVLADTGEDTILFCDQCDYAANQERAQSRLPEPAPDPELRPMETVVGEGLIQVEPLAKFLNIPVWKTTKTLLYEADQQWVAVMVRGDCDVNEIKLANFLNGKSLRLASPEVIRKLTGAEVGYAGPIELPKEVRVVADHLIRNRVNFECGANRTDHHHLNVNFGRDLPQPEFGDFKLAQKGEGCPRCAGTLQAARGIEVGHIFKLGTKYSEAMACRYLDAEGKSKTVIMGCYGIGVSRMAAAWIEQNHDEKGIIWSPQIAPYHAHLVGLNLEDAAVCEQAEKLYRDLQSNGCEVLFDDRPLRAGEKFGDADLMGMPIRLTISKRTCEQGKVELKLRRQAQNELVGLNEVIPRVKALLAG